MCVCVCVSVCVCVCLCVCALPDIYLYAATLMKSSQFSLILSPFLLQIFNIMASYLVIIPRYSVHYLLQFDHFWYVTQHSS